MKKHGVSIALTLGMIGFTAVGYSTTTNLKAQFDGFGMPGMGTYDSYTGGGAMGAAGGLSGFGMPSGGMDTGMGSFGARDTGMGGMGNAAGGAMQGFGIQTRSAAPSSNTPQFQQLNTGSEGSGMGNAAGGATGAGSGMGNAAGGATGAGGGSTGIMGAAGVIGDAVGDMINGLGGGDIYVGIPVPEDEGETYIGTPVPSDDSGSSTPDGDDGVPMDDASPEESPEESTPSPSTPSPSTPSPEDGEGGDDDAGPGGSCSDIEQTENDLRDACNANGCPGGCARCTTGNSWTCTEEDGTESEREEGYYTCGACSDDISENSPCSQNPNQPGCGNNSGDLGPLAPNDNNSPTDGGGILDDAINGDDIIGGMMDETIPGSGVLAPNDDSDASGSSNTGATDDTGSDTGSTGDATGTDTGSAQPEQGGNVPQIGPGGLNSGVGVVDGIFDAIDNFTGGGLTDTINDELNDMANQNQAGVNAGQAAGQMGGAVTSGGGAAATSGGAAGAAQGVGLTMQQDASGADNNTAMQEERNVAAQQRERQLENLSGFGLPSSGQNAFEGFGLSQSDSSGGGVQQTAGTDSTNGFGIATGPGQNSMQLRSAAGDEDGFSDSFEQPLGTQTSDRSDFPGAGGGMRDTDGDSASDSRETLDGTYKVSSSSENGVIKIEGGRITITIGDFEFSGTMEKSDATENEESSDEQDSGDSGGFFGGFGSLFGF